MPLKAKTELAEVRHLLINGVPEELNKEVANLLNTGWKVLEAKLVNFDAQNRLLTILYVLVRYPEAND